MTDPRPSVEDYDWVEAFGYAGDPGKVFDRDAGDGAAGELFGLADVVEFLGWSAGENDGRSWIAWGRLKDGRYFYLSAGCDYTGWDCQAGGEAWVSRDRETVWRQIPDDDRERMKEDA